MAKMDKLTYGQQDQSDLGNPFANLRIDLPPELDKTASEKTPIKTAPIKRKRGRVVLRRETAHRGGKCVLVVYDFESSVPSREIEDLGRRLRSHCGCGGTVKERAIELQGDQPARVRAFLEEEGFRVAGVS
jgi:translation initiation factor 1